MPLFEFDNIPERELMPGFHGRFVHTENNTHALWRIEEGAEAPNHSHPHEQIGIVISGQIQFNTAGEIKTLNPGDVYVIPGGVEHGAKTFDDPVQVMDVFNPVREEYKY